MLSCISTLYSPSFHVRNPPLRSNVVGQRLQQEAPHNASFSLACCFRISIFAIQLIFGHRVAFEDMGDSPTGSKYPAADDEPNANRLSTQATTSASSTGSSTRESPSSCGGTSASFSSWTIPSDEEVSFSFSFAGRGSSSAARDWIYIVLNGTCALSIIIQFAEYEAPGADIFSDISSPMFTSTAAACPVLPHEENDRVHSIFFLGGITNLQLCSRPDGTGRDEGRLRAQTYRTRRRNRLFFLVALANRSTPPHSISSFPSPSPTASFTSSYSQGPSRRTNDDPSTISSTRVDSRTTRA